MSDGQPPDRVTLRGRPRLLVVPHLYADNIAVREIELARRLTARFDVFVLKWTDALNVDASSVFQRRIKNVFAATAAALHRYARHTGSDRMTVVDVPVWQPVLFQKFIGYEKAFAICQAHNHRIFDRVLQDCKITHVLLASEFFGVRRTPDVRTFFDIVDWFPEDEFSSERLRKNRENLCAIGERVDGVFAVSEPLCEKLARECGLRPMPLPNGADLDRLRSIPAEHIQALRSTLGIGGKFAIGYIGNHGSYTGVDLVVNAFLAARTRMPDAVLLIIGPADLWRDLLAANRQSGVLATGNIAPSEIAKYFNVLDVGVLAQGVTTGTDFAFQIKVVEYSACRKIVVSTPLETWRRLAWPNVILAEPTADAWAEAFVRARSTTWQPEWDGFVDPYDWQAMADRAADIMLQSWTSVN